MIDFRTRIREILVTAGGTRVMETLEERRLLAAYEEVLRLPMEGGPLRLAAADFNSDGRSDIAALTLQGMIEISLSGAEAGSMTRPYSIGVPGETLGDVDVLDWNDDGFQDLLATRRADRDVYFFAGNGTGFFAVPQVIDLNSGSPASSSWTAAYGDFNGDGGLDIALANRDDNQVEIALRAGGPLTFGPVTAVAVGTRPVDIATGDFDGNGALDLVVPNRNSSNLTILRNIGGGTFGNAITRGTSTDPFRVAVGDVNGDGLTDIVTVSSGSPGAIQVLTSAVNGGSLDFVVAQEQSTVVGSGIAIGDIDLDLDLDVIAVSQNSTTVLRNNGGFATLSREDYSFGGGDVVLGNFDGAPGLDLAGANYDAREITFAFNRFGSGVFTGSAISSPLGGTLSPVSGATGDLDGDGDQDVVSLNPASASSTVSVFRNLGGYLSTPVGYSFGNGTNTLHRLVLADLNGDGFQDLLSADRVNDDFRVRLGAAGATFGAQLLALDQPGGVDGFGDFYAVADLTGDGVPDLVYRSQLTGISVAPGVGNGTFGAPVARDFGLGRDVSSVSIADIDGDGLNDVVVGEDVAFALDQISVFRNQGGGLFAGTEGRVLLSANADNISEVFLADVGGDARPDVVFHAGERVVVLVNQSTIGVPVFTTLSDNVLPGFTPQRFSAADVDADGDQDLLLASATGVRLLRNANGVFNGVQDVAVENVSASLVQFDGGQPPDLVTLNPSGAVAVALNSGNGRLAGVNSRTPTPATPFRVFAGDITGDGITDLISLSNSGANRVFVSRGTASGYEIYTSLDLGTLAATDAAFDDFNGDGLADLLVLDADATQRRLVLLAGTGTGTFFAAPQTVYLAAPSDLPNTPFTALAVGNFDGVPGLDAAVTLGQGGAFFSLRNNGSGTFQFINRTATDENPSAIALADFDGDGDLDAAVANADSGTLTVHANNISGLGLGVFQDALNARRYPTGFATPVTVAAADLNDDGKPEVVVGFLDNDAPIELFANVRDAVGTFLFTQTPFVPTSNTVVAEAPFLRLRDINGDGRPDILAGTRTELAILANDGTFNFPTLASYPLTASHFDTFFGNSDLIAEIVGVSAGSVGLSVLQSLPGAIVSLVSTDVAENSSTLNATVRFANAQFIDPASIGAGDLRLFDVGGYFAPGTLLGTPAVQQDGTLLATFSFPAPQEDFFQSINPGFWDASDNGQYFLELAPGAVLGNNQQALPIQLVQTYGLFFNSPHANIIGQSVTEGGTTFDVTVRYTDSVGDARGFSWDSIGNGDLEFFGPGGFYVLGTLDPASRVISNGTLTATYQFEARGGSWDNSDNGLYDVRVRSGEVIENQGFTVAPINLRNYYLFFSTPLAEVVSGRVVTSANGDGLEVTVRLTDTTGGLSYDSIGSGDFELYSPGLLDFSTTGNLLFKSEIVDGSVLATYGFLAREGFGTPTHPRFWDATDNGSYFLRANTNEVFGNDGVPVPRVALLQPGRSETFSLFFDTPGAEYIPNSFQPTSGGGATDFTIRIATAGLLDLGSINGDEFRIGGPDGFQQTLAFAPNSLVLESNMGGTARYLLRYTLTPPGGTWNAADNGTYQIFSNPDSFASQSAQLNLGRLLWSGFLFF